MTPVNALAAHCAELKLPDAPKAGVYVLILSESVVYVGQSTNVIARIGMHARSFAFDRAFWLPIETSAERMAVEGALARRFNPIHCRRASRKYVASDKAILADLGLSPDVEAATAFTARCNACWSEDSRRAAATAMHKAKAARVAFEKRYGIRWIRNADVRRRRVQALHLWRAVRPFVAQNLSHTNSVVLDSESVSANQRESISDTGKECA